MEQIAVVKTSKIKKIKEIRIRRIVYFVSFYLIAAVLLFSGIAKIINPIPLINTLKLIAFIPGSVHVLIATLQPVVEIGLALLLLMKIKPKVTLTFITVLFSIFLGFSIYGTAAGFGADCGCLPANL